MKKAFVSLVVLIILSLTIATTSFAHGGHGHGQNRIREPLGYAPCTVSDCDIENSHQHNENWYCGQVGINGQYEICGVADCVAVGLHEHDGEYYHCQNYSNGTGGRSGGGCHRR